MIHTPRLITLPKFLDQRGNLSALESAVQVPFEIARVYWIYDVPGGELRGSHAFRTTQEVIVALSGSFDVVLHDGTREHVFTLNRSYFGVYCPKLIWRSLRNFSTNSVALILASTSYDPAEYIRDFAEFQRTVADVKNEGLPVAGSAPDP